MVADSPDTNALPYQYAIFKPERGTFQKRQSLLQFIGAWRFYPGSLHEAGKPGDRRDARRSQIAEDGG